MYEKAIQCNFALLILNKRIIMKTISKLSVLVLLTATIFTSCSSDDGGGSALPSGSYVKASIDGADFQSTEQLTVSAYSTGNLVIQGSLMDGTTISLNLGAIDHSLETGVYNVNATNNFDVNFGSCNFMKLVNMSAVAYNSVNCENATGTIEITYIDETKVEGTFSFVGKEVKADETCNGGTVSITNGSFRGIFSN